MQSLKDEATETTPLVPSATDTGMLHLRYYQYGSDVCVCACVCVCASFMWADALFSDESTASGESDDYEIAKKYEMVRGL